MGKPTRLLVTGASGLVGSEVIARLMNQGCSVVALTHRAQNLIDNHGQSVPTLHCRADEFDAHQFRTSPPATALSVQGDVRQTDFGMSAQVRDAVLSEVDGIVHCAASTDFAAAQSVYDELNVGGTVHACELALAGDLPLVYVGTAYVCGNREGVIYETDLSDAAGFGNGYERSKFEAETHVRSVPGLKWSVVRPGIVTGDSETGVIRDRKNLYTVIKLIVEGKLRSLPGRYDATLSLAPTDVVAEVVVAAALNDEKVRGKTFHAVSTTELSLRQISDVFAEYPSFRIARFVPASAFSEDDLDPIEREYYLRIGTQYTNYFDGRRQFDTTNTRALLDRALPDGGDEYLRILLDECLDAGFLGAPLLSIDEAIQCLS